MRLDPTEADWGIDPFALPDDGLTEEEMVVRDLFGGAPPAGVDSALAVIERAMSADADINF